MPISDFRVVESIGKGSFASVYKVVRKSDNKLYALKRVKIGKMSKREVQDALNEQYKQDGHPQLLNYDVHNQYLQTLIAQGLLGLITLILVLLAPLFCGNRSFLSYSFVLIFATCILTESMLEVQKGVLFFAFFSSLLSFQKRQDTSPI